MNKIFSLLMLIIHFLKAVILSGWETVKIILFKSQTINSGITTLDYGQLNENTVSLLSALITLTPGTSVIEIDTDNQQLILHLLDLDTREKTLAAIENDFSKHLKVLSGISDEAKT